MSIKDNPKDKALAEALAAKTSETPLSWKLLENGTMIIIMVQGPKRAYSAEEVAKFSKPAPRATKSDIQPEQHRVEKEPPAEPTSAEARPESRKPTSKK